MIGVCLDRARQISHDKRRSKRAELLKHLDIEATIPSLAEEAEEKRQIIRYEFAAIQAEIDNAATVEELTVIITQI